MTISDNRDIIVAQLDGLELTSNRYRELLDLAYKHQQTLSAGGGGGGGGTVTLTDSEYFYWRVTVADATLGLAVDNLIRESVVNKVSTWRKVGASTDLASAPDITKIELAGSQSKYVAPPVATQSDLVAHAVAAINAGVTIPASATAKRRVIVNNSDRRIFVRHGATSPTQSAYLYTLEPGSPGGLANYSRYDGDWLGEVRLLADSATSGFVAVEEQT
jgi:hypothetical protein